MSTALTTTTQTTAIERAGQMAQAGQIANSYAERGVFADYLTRKSGETIRRQRADLGLFADFLCAAGVTDCPTADDLMGSPATWQGVTWGLVEAFREWQVSQGYAVGSVNVRLSTVKAYAGLATKAGVLSAQNHALIKTVAGYSRKEAKRVDERREQTRTGAKKAASISLTKEQADALKAQPDTPQGRRDAVIMALLLDHGLRVGELAGLEVAHFNLKAGTFTFYRPKVDKEQTHKLTADSLRAVRAWLTSGDATPFGPLLRGSRKGGKLTESGMTERAITDRVRVLGESVGVAGLSAHDCRHYWATRAAQQGTDPFRLQEAGGWSSLAMPRRYVEDARIANEGVKL
ncbi:MAG: site-specific integrase [Caldilineaceae bacterium]|nr:site-specific integrase [Caldilineaceae bacterium]